MVTGPKRLLRLGVDLGHAHSGLQLGGSLHVARRHLAARAAPRRPKVHQQRDLVALQVLVKCGLVQVNRLASEQRLLALPAVGRAGKLVSTDAVGGLAMGADDVQGFAHMCLLVAGALECKACRAALPESGGATFNEYAPVFIAARDRIHWSRGPKHR
jgi:hypothetical protein